MSRRSWSRDELLLAMNLYCQLPFGKLHARNAEIIQLADALNRSPSSVAMKLCNFASLDPAHQERGVRGLTKVGNADREVWLEFHSNWNVLAEESEELRRSLVSLDSHAQHDNENNKGRIIEPHNLNVGDVPFNRDTEQVRNTRVRLAQSFFRRSVLASYDTRCCVSSIGISGLLVASHILPWSHFPDHRTDPRNGLCLSRLHDAAFDRGLITFDGNYRLVLSRELHSHTTNAVLKEAFTAFEGTPMRLPTKFRPAPEYLHEHREMVFRG